MKPKIYLYCLRWVATDDYSGFALAEDGEFICGHISSSPKFSQSDMGYVGDTGLGKQKHAKYAAKYPDGYELVWLDEIELETHEGFQATWKLHQAQETSPSE